MGNARGKKVVHGIKGSVCGKKVVRVVEERLKKPAGPHIIFQHERRKALKAQSKTLWDEAEFKRSSAVEWSELIPAQKKPFMDKAKARSKQYAAQKQSRQQVETPQPTLVTRMSLRKVHEVISDLSDEQKEGVKGLGLGGLLSLQCTMLPHNFCQWIVDKFEISSRSLNVHGQKLKLTGDDVHHILGLPLTDRKVILGVFDNINDFYKEYAVDGETIPLARPKERLVKQKSAGEAFKREFILFFIGSFLCPPTGLCIPHHYLHAVVNLETFKTLNWCEHVVDYLADGGKIYVESWIKYSWLLILVGALLCRPSDSRDWRHNPLLGRESPRLKDWTIKGLRRIRKLKKAGNEDNSVRAAISVENGRVQPPDSMPSASTEHTARISALEKRMDEVFEMMKETHSVSLANKACLERVMVLLEGKFNEYSANLQNKRQVTNGECGSPEQSTKRLRSNPVVEKETGFNPFDSDEDVECQGDDNDGSDSYSDSNEYESS